MEWRERSAAVLEPHVTTDRVANASQNWHWPKCVKAKEECRLQGLQSKGKSQAGLFTREPSNKQWRAAVAGQNIPVEDTLRAVANEENKTNKALQCRACT